MLKQLYVPFFKVDEDERIVIGRATREELDTQDEITTFECAVDAFTEWSDYFQKVTGGDSAGNIREMHLPLAAGKALWWEADEADRSIVLASRIVDDEAWKKVKEKVYTGYSIGYRPIRKSTRTVDGRKVRVNEKIRMAETSLVDSPAVRSAVFTMIKRDAPPAKGRKQDEPRSDVQTLIFDKERYTRAEAEAWAKDHDFSDEGVDETEGSYRIRQRDPGEFEEDSLRTISLRPGVQSVIGRPKEAKADPAGPRLALIDHGIRKERYSALLARLPEESIRTKNIQSDGIVPALHALMALQSAMESEYWPLLMRPPEGVPGPDVQAELSDLAVLTAAAEAVLEFIGMEFREQLSAAEALVAAAGKGDGGETVAKLEISVPDTWTPEQTKGLTAVIDQAVKRIGGPAAGAKADTPPDPKKESKPAEPAPGATPPKEEGGEAEPAGSEPESKIDGAKILKAVAEVGSVVKGFDERLKRIETQPGPIGAALKPSGGLPDLTDETKAEISTLEKMVQQPMGSEARAELLKRLSHLQIRAANFGR